LKGIWHYMADDPRTCVVAPVYQMDAWIEQDVSSKSNR